MLDAGVTRFDDDDDDDECDDDEVVVEEEELDEEDALDDNNDEVVIADEWDDNNECDLIRFDDDDDELSEEIVLFSSFKLSSLLLLLSSSLLFVIVVLAMVSWRRLIRRLASDLILSMITSFSPHSAAAAASLSGAIPYTDDMELKGKFLKTLCCLLLSDESIMIGLLNDRFRLPNGDDDDDVVGCEDVFRIIDVDMVEENGRRRLEDFGKSNMAAPLRFCPGFNGGVMVVQQAILFFTSLFIYI